VGRRKETPVPRQEKGVVSVLLAATLRRGVEVRGRGRIARKGIKEKETKTLGRSPIRTTVSSLQYGKEGGETRGYKPPLVKRVRRCLQKRTSDLMGGESEV